MGIGVDNKDQPESESTNKNMYREEGDRDGVSSVILSVGPEDEEQIIKRGALAEKHSGLIEMDSRFLAQGVAKLADYGNVGRDVANLLRVVAGRLILENTPRDLWREYVPEGSDVKDWVLIEYRSFGSVARYTIFLRGKGTDRRDDDSVMQILMISNSGQLMERQHLSGRAAEEHQGYLNDWMNQQRRC